MMNILNEIISLIKLAGLDNIPMPILYIINTPSSLCRSLDKSLHLKSVVLVTEDIRYTKREIYLAYGNMQYVNRIIDAWIIDFIDLVSIYALDPQSIIYICKRNSDLVKLILEEPIDNNLCILDLHIITEEKLTKLNDTYTFNKNINTTADLNTKLTLYIADLLSYLQQRPQDIILKEEITRCIYSIVTSNKSELVDSLYKLYSSPRIIELINLEINFKLIAEARSILKSIKANHMLYILNNFRVVPGYIKMNEADYMPIIILNMHILLHFYSKLIIICSEDAYSKICRLLFLSNYKAYINRIYWLKCNDLKQQPYQIIDICQIIQNPYCIAIIDKHCLENINFLLLIAKQLNKLLLVYESL